MALALPMEVVAPVLGIGAIIAFMTGGIVVIRWAATRFPRSAVLARDLDEAERDQAIEDLQARVAELEPLRQRVVELEERLDFTERLLASRRDESRLGPG